MNEDSIALLKECNSGCKSATNSMEQVLQYTDDGGLKKLIEDCNKKHIKLGDECHEMLNKAGCNEEDPSKFVSKMAEIGTEIKLMMNDDSYRIAELMVDGCNMGIKSISKAINKYTKADSEVKNLSYEIISLEQDFMNDLLAYL